MSTPVLNPNSRKPASIGGAVFIHPRQLVRGLVGGGVPTVSAPKEIPLTPPWFSPVVGGVPSSPSASLVGVPTLAASPFLGIGLRALGPGAIVPRRTFPGSAQHDASSGSNMAAALALGRRTLGGASGRKLPGPGLPRITRRDSWTRTQDWPRAPRARARRARADGVRAATMSALTNLAASCKAS